MQPTDFQRFKHVMAGMGRVFGADVDGVILDAYWLALRDWDLAAFEAAAAHLMATSEFMPRPAAFSALRKAGEETPGEAWARALAYVRGGYRGATPGGRVDRVVRAMGGYSVIGGDIAGTPFREKRFVQLWNEIGGAEEVRQALPSVARLSGPQRVVPQIVRQS